MDQMSLWCLYCQLWLYLSRCSSLFFYLFVFCFCFCFLMALNVNGGWHTLLPNLYLFYAFQGQISEHSTSPPIFFKFLPTPFPPTSTLTTFLLSWFFDLAGDLVAFDVLFYLIVLWYVMIKALHTLSLGTIVPEGPCCVFYVIRRQVYWGLVHNVVHY